MVVLVGNLPKQAAEKDLCQMLRIPAGKRVRIIKKSSRSGLVQRFALVPVEGDHQARKLIKRAQGMDWQGQKLIAHEYQHRTGANERRRIDWRSHVWSGIERRQDERRSSVVPADSLVA
jgi:hypothetical protein